jgi:hypothetical protein
MNVWIAACLYIGSLFAVFLAALECGFQVGRRNSNRERPGTSVVEGALLGLLGLILGFSFSGGLSRIESRRHLIVLEANDIGTAYRRIDLLPTQDQAPLRALFSRYLTARISAYENVDDLNVTEARFEAAQGIQDEIWNDGIAAWQHSDQKVGVLSFLTALNEMFDVNGERRMVLRVHNPNFILFLMVSIALASSLLAGYSLSARGVRYPLHMIVFAFAIALTVYAVVDVDYPRLGVVRMDSADRALTQLRDVMK